MSLATPKAGKRAMSLFNPKDLLFETCVWDSFGRQEATRTLAIEIALLEPGERTLTMPYVAAYTPQHGFVHAGISRPRSIAPAAMRRSRSCPKMRPSSRRNSNSTCLLRPEATASFSWTKSRNPGGQPRSAWHTRLSSAFAVSHGEGKLSAAMSGTLMALFDRADIRS